MHPTDEPQQRTLGAILLAWWQGWKRKRNALAELTYCGSEAVRIARDIGVAPAELRVLAAKRPDSADLLHRRLALLRLDADYIAVADGVAVVRDLQRVCTACDSKARCARDLAAHPSTANWQDYCPNADTLEALATEANDEKALVRLERRQARNRSMQ
jgi:Family of unknown function (DUF6455)